MNEIEDPPLPENDSPDGNLIENGNSDAQESVVKEAAPKGQKDKTEDLKTVEQTVITKDVDKQFNIANLQQLNVGFTVDQQDPTEEFPSDFSKAKPYHSPDEVAGFAQKLMQVRLLLVASPSGEAVDSAVFALLNRPELSGFDRRLLSRSRFDIMSPLPDEKEKPNVEEVKPAKIQGEEGVYKTATDGVFSLDNLLARKINKGLPSVIVAEPESRSFLDSILRCNNSEEAKYQQQLTQKNLFLIVKVDSATLLRRVLENPILRFPQWLVSALRFMLHQNFEQAEAREFESGLEDQRLRGLWGEDADPNMLTEKVEFYLSRSKSAFKSKYFELQEILDNPNSETAHAAEEKRRNLAPEAFLSRTKNPVAFHLAFLGAWFEKMSVTEFDKLAFHLFSDDSKQHSVGTKKRQFKLGDGSMETTEEPDYRSLLALWRERKDEYREEAQLTTMRPLDSQYRYVEFTEDFLRVEVRRFFEERYASFAVQNFDLIFKIVFFDEDASPGFIKNLAQLNAQMALQEPSSALSRLTEISFNIHRAEQRRDAEAAEQLEKSSDLSDIFRMLEQKGAFQRLKYLFFQRIYLLVSEFWDAEQLRPVVEKFFDWLLREGNFEPLHYLTNQLWNTHGFNSLFWARQLIERGDETAKNSTFRMLIHRLSQEPADSLWKYLDEIRDSLPEKKMPSGQFSRFSEYTLAFIVHFATVSSEKTLPASAKDAPLLAPFLSDEDSGYDRWEKLLNWLFHPALGAAMVKVERDYQFQDPAPIRAYVLGQWFWQLHGSGEPLSGQTEEILGQMLRAIPTATSLRDFRSVLEPLRNIAYNYRENRDTRPRYYALQYLVQLLRDRNPFEVA